MPSVRAISDQTGFTEGKLIYRRLIAARTEGSRATLSVPRSSVVAAHLLHELEAHLPGGRNGLLLLLDGGEGALETNGVAATVGDENCNSRPRLATTNEGTHEPIEL